MSKFHFLSYKDALAFSKKMTNEFVEVKLKNNANGAEVEIVNRGMKLRQKATVSLINNADKDILPAKKTKVSIIKINGKFEYLKTKNLSTTVTKKLRHKRNDITKKTLAAIKIADKILARGPKEKKKNTSMYFNKIKRK